MSSEDSVTYVPGWFAKCGVSWQGNAPVFLIAVWNTKETRHLVMNDADPEPCEEDQANDP